MPHVVVKATAVGSAGDLSRITEKLEGLDVNILAIGGGEGVVGQTETGVLSILIDPEDSGTVGSVVDELTGLGLANVEVASNIQIELPNEIGELRKAADAVQGFNIRSIVMMAFGVNTAHVGLGFDPGEVEQAERALQDAGIAVIPHAE
ncbi:MAG TPA: hypothetical protein VFV72_14510 [Candidatus Limnocylindrales bacterium]|nr:hypothetical protein [Candidatus Limnocylindrales bacterium]